MPGMRTASMDFPTPGAPVMRRWCPPAAATSMAWRASNCPLTSDMSGGVSGPSPSASAQSGASGAGSQGTPMASATWARCHTSATSTPARPASSPHPSGTTIPPPSPFAAASAAGRTPRTRRTEPSRPSSPMTTEPAYLSAPPIAPRMATAMPRSNAVPAFGVPAGDRLIVSRQDGKATPAEAKAARSLSRDSEMAASGRPTMVTAGSPRNRTASMRTGRPSIPTTAIAVAVPSLMRGPRRVRRGIRLRRRR